MSTNHKLDCSNLLCPMPVIKTQNALKELNEGDILEVTCTDPGTLSDIPTWCRINQQEVLETIEHDRTIIFTIKKTAN
ncbi:sulfurtransferase TusA family protein [Kangiella koreensis]|uniref:SirA family protein n=1 Tax=Kangiella koreensis (strain DSM 16069 / JCM 12317 / KCTC 12182 / SW-125) TaxID=523791 RepID=C7R8C7_KANKD|nr:sulfurtransferase TusA family protein [Kangiella koreensis]ACV27692.1 SirA family protein [Kangiella koreensis DSM 16069]